MDIFHKRCLSSDGIWTVWMTFLGHVFDFLQDLAARNIMLDSHKVCKASKEIYRSCLCTHYTGALCAVADQIPLSS